MTTPEPTTNSADTPIPDLDIAHDLFREAMREHKERPGLSRPDLFAQAKNLSPEAFYHGLLFPLMFEASLYDPLLNRPGALLRGFLREMTECLSFPNAYPVPPNIAEFFVKSFHNFDANQNQQKTLKVDVRRYTSHLLLSMLGQSIDAFGPPQAWWGSTDPSFVKGIEFKLSHALLKNKYPIPKKWAEGIFLSFLLRAMAQKPPEDPAAGGSLSAALVYDITRQHGFVKSVQMENDELVIRFKSAPQNAIALGDQPVKLFLSLLNLPWDHYTLFGKKNPDETQSVRLGMDAVYDKAFKTFPHLADGVVKAVVGQQLPPVSFFRAHHHSSDEAMLAKLMQNCFEHCSDQSILDLMAFCKECAKSDPGSALKNCERAHERYTILCKREIEESLSSDEQANHSSARRDKKSSKI